MVLLLPYGFGPALYGSHGENLIHPKTIAAKIVNPYGEAQPDDKQAEGKQQFMGQMDP